MKASQLWATAYHEAAHAVVAEISGIRVDGVSIGRSVVDTGLGLEPAKGHVLITRVNASDFEVACMFAAGPVAEADVTGSLRWTLHPGSDFDQVTWFTRGDREILDFVISETRKAIDAHRHAIERLARILLEKSEICRLDVHSAMEAENSSARASLRSQI
jgi:hypothetical protein